MYLSNGGTSVIWLLADVVDIQVPLGRSNEGCTEKREIDVEAADAL